MLITSLLLASCLIPASEANIEWASGSFMTTVGKARAADKPVMIYFWSNQSEQCRSLWDNTLSKPDAAGILDDFTMYSADTGTDAGYKLVEQFHISTLPTLLVLDAEGQANDVILGAINLPNLASEIQRIESGEGTLSTLRAAVENTPTDIELRGKLTVKFGDLGMHEAFALERTKIYSMDPQFAHATTAEFRVREIQKEIEQAAGDEGAYEYKPLISFIKGIEHKNVKYTSWAWIASVADYKEDSANARGARVAMWENVPETSVARDGFMLSQYFYGLREELSKKEKRFALQVAQDTLAAVEAWSVKNTSSAAGADGEVAQACPADCYCADCVEGCVGEGERLAERKLYVARASENLALILKMNGKRRDALAAIERSIELDPENEAYLTSRAVIKERG